MSLLRDVHVALETDPDVVVVGVDYHHVFGSFNTHVYRLAPSSQFRLDRSGLEALFEHLQSLVPHEPFRVYNFFDKVDGHNSGTIYYTETIGSEEVVRTFTVEDVSSHWGEVFEKGENEPVVRDLIRTIQVRLYPTARRARYSAYGMTVFETPVRTAS